MLESIGQVVWIDYLQNKLKQAGNNPIVQVINRNSTLFDLWYLRNDSLFYFNTENKKADSLDLRVLTPMEVTVAIESNSKIPYVLAGFSLSGLVAGFVILRRRRKKKLATSGQVRIAQDELKESDDLPELQVVEKVKEGTGQHTTNTADEEMLNSDDEADAIFFNATEKDLIVLCLERSETGGYADIEEINHVLGIKNKNKGLQKKVRSEVFNSVNNKFREYTKSNNGLIESVRNKNDKRYFDYFIESRNFSAVRSLLRLQ